MDTFIKAAAGGLVGIVLGWSANALTLVGRVDAVEKAVYQIARDVRDMRDEARQK